MVLLCSACDNVKWCFVWRDFSLESYLVYIVVYSLGFLVRFEFCEGVKLQLYGCWIICCVNLGILHKYYLF